MKIPVIEWIPFDKDNPPDEIVLGEKFLVFLRENDYDDDKTWTYHVDITRPYGSYIDNFWDTMNDWYEGQRVEVLAYAHFPQGLKEDDLIEKSESIDTTKTLYEQNLPCCMNCSKNFHCCFEEKIFNLSSSLDNTCCTEYIRQTNLKED